MAKVKVNFSRLKELSTLLVKSLRSEKQVLGDKVIELMKDTMLKGQSPVRGVGRYAKYKDPKKIYPKQLKKKSPVNLKLSGDMQRAMKARIKSGRIALGVFNKKQAAKMDGNEKGERGQPAPRPVFPREEGQQFTVKIQRDIVRWYKELVKKAVKRRR
jgi:uncharacterized protein (DUF4415 family)